MKFINLLILLLILSWPFSVTLAKSPLLKATPEAAGVTNTIVAQPSVLPATLTLQNRAIITMRAPLLGYTPQERVEAAKVRISRITEQGVMGPASVVTHPEGVQIRIGDTGVFYITPKDINELEGDNLDDVGKRAARNLSIALNEIRQAREPRFLLRASLFSLAMTIILIFVVACIIRVRRWLSHSLEGIIRLKVHLFTFRGFTQHIDMLIPLIHVLAKLVAWMVGLFSAFLWITLVFEQFPYTRPWGEGLENYLIEGLLSILRAMMALIPSLFIVIIIFFITRFVNRLVVLFFEAVESGWVSLPGIYSDMALPTRRIVTTTLWLFAIIMMYPYLPGSGSSAFKGVSVFIGLLLSIGSASSVNQAVSGLVLMYSRALKVGDYVQIGETEGTVTVLGPFSTRILTPMGELVSLPNTFITGTTTKNFSREDETGGVLLTTSITIGYNTPWRQVNAMLIEAAGRTPGLFEMPAPFVLQKSLSDFFVEYMVCAKIVEPSKRISVLDVLHRNIQDIFNENSVQIMSPHYIGDPAEKIWVPKEKWYEAPANREEEHIS